MSIKKIEMTVCDKCGKEIKGRLIVHVCPCCGKECCIKCQTAEDARHKPREKKRKAEQGAASPVPVTPDPPSLLSLEETVTERGK